MYSDEIEKVCSLCEFAQIPVGSASTLYCRKRKKDVNIADEACKAYKYDILKRKVRRKKPYTTALNPEDFEI